MLDIKKAIQDLQCSLHASYKQVESVKTLLLEFNNLFARNVKQVTATDITQHVIDMRDARSINIRAH